MPMSQNATSIALAIRRTCSSFLLLTSLGVYGTALAGLYIRNDAFMPLLGIGFGIMLVGLFIRPTRQSIRSAQAMPTSMNGAMAVMNRLPKRSPIEHRQSITLSNQMGLTSIAREETLALATDETTDEELIDLAKAVAAEQARHELSPARIIAHESAHAVVAHLIGATVTQVAITPENSSAANSSQGSVRWTSAHNLSGVDSAFHSLHGACAGWVLDLEEDAHHTGSNSDINVMELSVAAVISTGQRPTGYHGELTRDGLLRDALERTQRILDESRPALRAVIELLPQAGVVSGRLVRAAIDAALPEGSAAARETISNPSSDAMGAIDPEGS